MRKTFNSHKKTILKYLFRYVDKFSVLHTSINISCHQTTAFRNAEIGCLLNYQSIGNQRVHLFKNVTTFTGKEKDSETGFSYFGARYLDHDLMTLWLSVDPMADKYPSISPYVYCAWNPIRLTDPSGDSIILEGEAFLINYVIRDMQRRTKNLNFEVDNNGVVSCTGNPIEEEDYYMMEIINNDQVKINLLLQRDSKINAKCEMMDGGADAFLGNVVYLNRSGELRSTANQLVNVPVMNIVDPESGTLIWHAISEAYEGALTSIERNHSCSFTDSDYRYYYDIAHEKANSHFCGKILYFEFNKKSRIPVLNCE